MRHQSSSASDRNFALLFHHSPALMAIIGTRTRCILDANRSFLAKLGFERAEVIGKSVDEIDLFADKQEMATIEASMRGSRRIRDLALTVRKKDGAFLSGLLAGEFIRFAGETCILAVYSDQTELERFFSINLDLLCIADVDGHFLKLNRAWTEILGYRIEDLRGKVFLDFVHPEDVPSTLNAIAKLDAQEEVLNFVNRYRCADGSYRYIEWRSHPYGERIYAAARDITERVQWEQRLVELSTRDPLTGIFNRRHIHERLAEVIPEYRRSGRLYSVAVIDLDHFKRVNDSYGHQAGDFVLKEMTAVISSSLRPYDLLGRYGGEEFIVVFPETRRKQAKTVMCRILDTVRSHNFEFEGRVIRVTFSVGVCDCGEFDPVDLTVEDLVKRADQRLYRAKQLGRDRIEDENE